MDRLNYIEARLDHYTIEQCGAASSVIPRPLWEQMRANRELGRYASIGLSWPFPYDEPPAIVPYCPELLRETAEHLDEEEFDAFLLSIEFLTAKQLSRWGERPVEEAQVLAEEDLRVNGPDNFALLNGARMAMEATTYLRDLVL